MPDQPVSFTPETAQKRDCNEELDAMALGFDRFGMGVSGCGPPNAWLHLRRWRA
jgi:hypothetical protein